jgi:hypothetical protein
VSSNKTKNHPSLDLRVTTTLLTKQFIALFRSPSSAPLSNSIPTEPSPTTTPTPIFHNLYHAATALSIIPTAIRMIPTTIPTTMLMTRDLCLIYYHETLTTRLTNLLSLVTASTSIPIPRTNPIPS